VSNKLQEALAEFRSGLNNSRLAEVERDLKL